MYSAYIALGAVLLLSLIGGNHTVAYAALIVIVLKLLGLNSLLGSLNDHGLNWGILLLTVAILVPIATGEVTVQNMIDSVRSPMGIVALIAGVLAAMAGGSGLELLKTDPQIVATLIIGTMAGVFFFHGIAVGPLIAGGITYAVMHLFSFLH